MNSNHQTIGSDIGARMRSGPDMRPFPDWGSFRNSLELKSELETHPESSGQCADLFSSVSFESTEIEYLDLLHGLVLATKPNFLLETGTHKGISAAALGFAVKRNFEESGIEGSLVTLENVADFALQGSDLIQSLGLAGFVKVANSCSLEFIKEVGDNKKFDFVYFDSKRRIRPKEFALLQGRQLLSERCTLVFHDTCEGSIKPSDDTTGDQDAYLTELAKIEEQCGPSIRFPLSRGMTVVQWQQKAK